MVLLLVQGAVNEATLSPTKDGKVEVEVEILLHAANAKTMERILGALQKMHATVGEKTSFRREEKCWRFIVHADEATPVAA